MATNFPDTSVNNPDTSAPWADGDIFDDTAESGLIYYWYDPVWKTKANGEGGWPNLQEVTDEGNTTTNDIETSGDIQSTSQNGGPLAGFRNQFINGNFTIWQRGEPPMSGISLYGVDRWFTNARVKTIERQAFNNPPGVGFGLSMTSFESGNIQARQAIELLLAANNTKAVSSPYDIGTTWTVSVWSTQPVSFQAQFSDSVTGGAGSGNVSEIIAITEMVPTGETSGAYTKYSLTFEISASPNDSNRALVARFQYVAGAADEEWIIAGAQLEPGPVATPFEHRPYGTELALCQRYYQRYRRLRVYSGSITGSSDRFLFCPRTTEMRIAPTETGTSNRGTAVFTGKAEVLEITVNGIGDGESGIITNYTADAEL